MLAIFVRAGAPGIAGFQVSIKICEDPVVQLQVDGILGRGVDLHPPHLAQEEQRVVVKTFPQGVVDTVEKPLGVGVPGPPQVVGQFTQPVDAARQVEMVGSFG